MKPREDETQKHDGNAQRILDTISPLIEALMGQCPRGSRQRFAERLPSSRAGDWRLRAKAGCSPGYVGPRGGLRRNPCFGPLSRGSDGASTGPAPIVAPDVGTASDW